MMNTRTHTHKHTVTGHPPIQPTTLHTNSPTHPQATMMPARSFVLLAITARALALFASSTIEAVSSGVLVNLFVPDASVCCASMALNMNCASVTLISARPSIDTVRGALKYQVCNNLCRRHCHTRARPESSVDHGLNDYSSP
jgi:hypothetical protein